MHNWSLSYALRRAQLIASRVRNARTLRGEKPSLKLLNAELLNVNHCAGSGDRGGWLLRKPRHSLAITRSLATRGHRVGGDKIKAAKPRARRSCMRWLPYLSSSLAYTLASSYHARMIPFIIHRDGRRGGGLRSRLSAARCMFNVMATFHFRFEAEKFVIIFLSPGKFQIISIGDSGDFFFLSSSHFDCQPWQIRLSVCWPYNILYERYYFFSC